MHGHLNVRFDYILYVYMILYNTEGGSDLQFWKLCRWGRAAVVLYSYQVNELSEMWRDVRFAHISVWTVCDNVDSFTENTASVPKVFVQQVYHIPIGMKPNEHYGRESLTILLYKK